MSEPVLLLLIATFSGAIAAVWKLLSSRIASLETKIAELTEKVTNISAEKARAEAERDLHKERSADLKQRLTVREIEVSEFKRLLDLALTMRATVEELGQLKQKLVDLHMLED